MTMLKKRISSLTFLFVLSLTACQPIQAPTPAAGTVPPAATTPAATPSLTGDWEGRIKVAGLNLTILVKFAAAGDSLGGMIDIPEQGATDLPLKNITADLPTVHFEMLEGPQLAIFDGQLADDGTLSGSFTQSGVEGTFELARAGTGVPADTAIAPSVVQAAGEVYTDPQRRFSVPVPTNWTVVENESYVTLASPDEQIKVQLLALENRDPEDAIAAAWQQVNPGFQLEVDEVMTPPPPLPGVEKVVSITYKDPADEQHIVLGQAELHEGISYVLLLDAQLAGLQVRSAQVQIIGSGLKILALAEIDLSGVEPLLVDEAVLIQLEDYIRETMERYQIPGAAIAVVQNGEIVYTQGFGVRDPATGEPVTPETLMRTGSTGKSLTTLLMATLVDDGLMTWDTPVVEILPTFAVKDPELSRHITVRNLVCACTGVPRRDFELIFNANSLSAEDVVASLRTFDFFTDFGEAFQYSNQMVATGGYIAGMAAGDGADDLYTAYGTALQERVLNPIGMISTTLSFTEVEASGNYAIPHAADFDLSYQPFSLEIEKLLNPVAPAGAHWATVLDMARYLITELNEGVAPDGNRVVSSENLRVTWEPQVPVAAETSYGLGWFIDEYKGQRLIQHGGNTFGFTSDFAFLPDADLGIVVLTNAQGSNFFNEGVRTRLFELVFQQQAEADTQITFGYEQLVKANQEVIDKLLESVDVEKVQPFVGRYTNEALGEVALMLANNELFFDAGEFSARLLPLLNDEDAIEGYLLLDPPLKGLLVKLEESEDDELTLVIGEGAIQYVFTRLD